MNTFQKTYGKSNIRDQAYDIIETPDKGFITGGWGGDNNYCFLMKIDRKGEIVWSKQIYDGSKQNGLFRKFIKLKDGNYIGIATSYRHQWTDTWIVKFDENGEIIWNREMTYPDGIGTNPYSIVETSDGGLAMAEWYQPYPNFAGSLITKLDANGNLLWSKSYLGNVSTYDLLETKGTLFVVGSDTTSKGGLILKFNSSNGAFLGSKSISIEKKQTIFYNIIEQNDKFYINAYTYYIFNSDYKINQDILILDVDLNLLSVQKFDFGFQRTWEFSAMFPTPDEGFIAAQTSEYGNSNVILYKIKKDGTVDWKREFPKTGGEFLFSIKPTSDGGVVGAGVSNDFGSYYNYYNDIFVLKTDAAGLTNCTVADPDLIISNPSVKISTPTIDYKSITFPITDINSTVIPVITPVNTYCEKIFVPTCSMLKITGNKNVCSTTEEVTYKAVRDDGCTMPASWDIDSAYATLVGSNDSTITLKFKKTGEVKLTCLLKDPCQPLSDSLYINISNDPVKIDLGQDSFICPNNTLILKAESGFSSYLWQDGSSDSTLRISKEGQYYVTATNRCGTPFSDTVIIHQAPHITFDAGPDRIKCNSDTLHLSSPTGFLNYLWSNNYNISSTNTRDVIVNPTIDTAYYVTAEKYPGCFVFDTIHITVYHSPAIDLGNDINLCTGDSLLLNAGTSFQTYHWSNGETTQATFVKSAGQYFVTGTTVNGCQSKDTVQVMVHPIPVITLNKDTVACKGIGKELDAGDFNTYYWSTGANDRSIRVNTPGKYVVTVTDKYGCINKDSVNIKVLISPPINFLPPDTAICSYETLTLRPTDAFTFYKWSNGSSASQIVISKPDLYTLLVKAKNACIGIDSIIVNPKNCIEGVFLPNAFTPNNDGKNDLFKAIIRGHVSKFELMVYNRWGEVVFQTTDPLKGWDGRIQGSDVQSDVYIWLCKYQMEGNQLKIDKGTVMLIH